jgi:hypothetical protein
LGLEGASAISAAAANATFDDFGSRPGPQPKNRIVLEAFTRAVRRRDRDRAQRAQPQPLPLERRDNWRG